MSAGLDPAEALARLARDLDRLEENALSLDDARRLLMAPGYLARRAGKIAAIVSFTVIAAIKREPVRLAFRLPRVRLIP